MSELYNADYYRAWVDSVVTTIRATTLDADDLLARVEKATVEMAAYRVRYEELGADAGMVDKLLLMLVAATVASMTKSRESDAGKPGL